MFTYLTLLAFSSSTGLVVGVTVQPRAHISATGEIETNASYEIKEETLLHEGLLYPVKAIYF
jgi:tRNA A22 N-methylase